MDPRLVAIAGPLKGATVSLVRGTNTIGRDISSDLVVSDSRVSRRHASIALNERGDWGIRDLESANGTLVNGVPIREVVLKEGDVIQIGASLFLFGFPASDAQVSSPSPVGLEDSDWNAEPTVRVREEDLVYFHRERFSSDLPSGNPLLHELQSLLSISKSIGTMRDAEALQHRLLDHIFEVIPAARAAILLVAPDTDDFVSSTCRDKKSLSIRISAGRSASQQGLRGGLGLLSNPVMYVGTFNPTGSLIASKITSLVCVPIMGSARELGVIYADTSDSAVRFNERDLHLLAGIAALPG